MTIRTLLRVVTFVALFVATDAWIPSQVRVSRHTSIRLSSSQEGDTPSSKNLEKTVQKTKPQRSKKRLAHHCLSHDKFRRHHNNNNNCLPAT
jgi:hypothetical protein